MAQELTFIAGGANYVCAPTKLERSKVYGSTDKVILDDNNNECKAVSMDESGTIIIPKGGIALGIVDENLRWVERSELQVVNSNGEKVEQIPSTFTTPVVLDKKVTVEHYLDHSITTIYQLTGDYSELIQFVGNDIYEFRFNYRNSYDTNPAFLITNGTELFMLVGYKNDFEFITLEETAVIDSETEETETDDFDIDFSMM
ncbi:hypothetical protein [Bacteroides sp. 519]|uniref:hypothetical protein n=1 Tax=Bacteroides sp. 519 TaxID=2302937 RepID=UPI0013D6A292|nr:hypothetical protein [Bacteroides sp. 519]NDV57653.1 hypothetical protein [Bacteroides sp. 519]